MCIKMEIKIDKEDIVIINKRLGGDLSRDGSLDFAIDKANQEKRNPYRKIAYLVRAIIVDHPFSDGNKRTALEIVVKELYRYEIECNIEKLTKIITKTAKKNIHEIIKIERMLRKCCQKE